MGSNGDMSPRNMPLWHEDYFELKVLEKEQMQGKLFTSLNCLKIKVKNFPFVNLSLPLNSVGEYIYDTRETDSFICGSLIPFLTPVRWIQSSSEALLGDLQISLYVFPCSVLLDSSVTSICSQGFTVGGYR